MLWSLLIISLIGNAHLVDDDGACSNTQYLTLKGETSQSSDYTPGGVSYSSERAIDGNKTACAHTFQQQKSSWKIDLLGVYKISCISIYNIDQFNTNMNGARIHIGNSRENNGTANRIITNFKLNEWNDFKFNTSVSGRYITVFSPGSKHLILCEVKIYSTIKDPPFMLINKKKTWEDALYYCRDRNMDLASILDEEAQAWAELEAKKANTPFVWLGLHYTCTLDFWFWVDDHRLEFNRWAPKNKTEECDMSATMETKEHHLWFSKSDYEKFNFICAK